MISQEQIKDLQDRLAVLESCLDIAGKRQEVEKKTQESLAPDFWNDPKAAELFMKKLSGLKSWVSDFEKAREKADDLEVLFDLEPEDSPELDEAYAIAVDALEVLELRNMLGGEGDNLGAVLTINSGAGGTEANDWSAMLMRM